MSKGVSWRKLEWEIEEIILALIIFLNILDAFEIITPDLDYIKKIISWSALGLLVYRAAPTKIFVGTRKPAMDIILILGYFAMITKNLISYAYTAIDSASSFLYPFYSALIKNAITIEVVGLYIGFFMILFVCFNLSLRTPLKAPSILHLMHADKQGASPKIFALHFSSLLLIIVGFFLVFFNLLMEWLAIAIDAPLLMTGLAIYFFFIIKHKEKFSTKSFLSRFGDFGAKFYQSALDHLKYRSSFLRIVSGMLILHVVTDIFTFLWPYFFNLKDPLYYSLIGYHPTLFDLLILDVPRNFLTFFIHLSNVVGLLFFMVTPVIMWFVLYDNKRFKAKTQFLATISFCLLVMMFNPTFAISAFKGQLISGVDILGVSAFTHQLIPFELTLLFAAGLSLLFVSVHGKSLLTILTIASKVFFGMYTVLYVYSISSYYLTTIKSLLFTIPFLSILFAIFFLITILFYVVGLLSFLKDTHDHLDEHLSIK